MTEWWSLAAALVLAGVHAGGGFWSLRPGPERRRWTSAAAGASVAYVFVEVLPELALRHEAFVRAAGEGLMFAEERLYLAALAGFLVFFGLEHMVLVSRARRRQDTGRDAARAVYWLQLAGFGAYSWLIGYLVVDRAAAGQVELALYAAAMALHFHVIDAALREEHGRPFDRVGRWILAAGVVAGWVMGATMHLPEAVFGRLFGVVVGGVVITSMRGELPRDGQGEFWSFCLGAAAYALLLMAA